MKFRFIWIGKTRDKRWRGLQDEYLSRLEHFVKCEITELKDSGRGEGPEDEAIRLLKAIDSRTHLVLLDVKGRRLTSPQLAGQIEAWQLQAHKEITFLIGGVEGIAPAVAERANDTLSLSFLTFTHDMCRTVLLEQLYRAYSILKGFPYQK